MHADNCTHNEATDYSPYFLLFGRETRLPVDICFGLSLSDEAGISHMQYVNKWKADLTEAYKLESAAAFKNLQKNKTRYDCRVKHQRPVP